MRLEHSRLKDLGFRAVLLPRRCVHGLCVDFYGGGHVLALSRPLRICRAVLAQRTTRRIDHARELLRRVLSSDLALHGTRDLLSKAVTALNILQVHRNVLG